MDDDNAGSAEETEFGGSSASRQKKVIYFANGDTLEQDSSDEEGPPPLKEPFSASVNTAQTSLRQYCWRLCMKAGKMSLQTCDFIGGKLASLIGLNMAKYQYAIDQFHHDRTEPQGALRRVTDGAEGEMSRLSQQKSAEYGATESPASPGHWATHSSTEQNKRTAGSHNQGYQED